MQAIHTKFMQATNSRGARIKAYTNAGLSATASYDYSLNQMQAHFKAVKALVTKHGLDWDLTNMCFGDSADGNGYVFCFADSIVGAE